MWSTSPAAGCFHVWCLPAVWLIPVGILWGISSVMSLRGDANTAATIAGIGGLWLADALGGHHGILPNGVAVCIGAVLSMAVVGLLQDLLRVPRRIIVLYDAVPLVSFTCLHVLLGRSVGEREVLTYVRWLLLHFSGALYVIPPLSCTLYLVFLVARKLRPTL